MEGKKAKANLQLHLAWHSPKFDFSNDWCPSWGMQIFSVFLFYRSHSRESIFAESDIMLCEFEKNENEISRINKSTARSGILTVSSRCEITWKITNATRIHSIHSGSSAFPSLTEKKIVTNAIMWAVLPPSQCVQLNNGLRLLPGCGLKNAPMGWKKQINVVIVPRIACGLLT